jgi:HAD superfamily hydrolase (TIGR01484 family)
LKTKIVFSDFDGTLTVKGFLTKEFFEILSAVHFCECPLVIVTGRSLSWGHFLLTHFPLDHVIVEGGGIVVSKSGKNITEEALVPVEELERLAQFTELLKKKFPGVPLSADSFGRKSDRAIELFDMDADADLESVRSFMDEHKINHSTSNVHLNFWCGEMSKSEGSSYVLRKYYKGIKEDEALFFGDALNDQSMFKDFKHCVGVSNIAKCLDQLDYRPSVILEGEENNGPFGVLNYLKSIS